VHATRSLAARQARLASPRSLSRALGDIRDGLEHRELWAHLAWQDIKQRYRRSVLGPFWITISQGVIALGLGLLYGVLFGAPFETFIPYVTTGLIIWQFISNCLTEGMRSFIADEGLIKHLPAPLTVYALRTVWRQTIMFAHNMIVYAIVLGIFFVYLDQPYSLQGEVACTPGKVCHPGLSWHYLMVIPGFALLALNAAWVSLFLGIISTRFRDFPQLIDALVQLLFYLTPIVWSLDTVLDAAGRRHQLAFVLEPIVHLDPFYDLIQIVRGPLTGGGTYPIEWEVVGILTVLGWGLALLFMRNYRARVAYWV
jgi:ABC-2 type transport system permease protein